MKIITFILAGLLLSVPTFGQDKTPVQKTDTVKPAESKIVQPDTQWMQEYKQTISLNKQIDKINSETGVLDLINLRDELSNDLLSKIPKGYEFQIDPKTQQVTFVLKPVEKPATQPEKQTEKK